MKTIKVDYPIQNNVRKNKEDCVIALGFFDGVHLGHQKIIQTAKKIAANNNLKLAVMTFFPHPSSVIKKGKQITSYLTPLAVKEKRFKELGVDIMYVVEFNEKVAKIPHYKFVDDYLCGLSCKHAVAGFDYKYGFKGKGDMAQLPIDSKGRFEVTTVSKLSMYEQKVSSTLLRSFLSTGKVENIPDYLGDRYKMLGTMIGRGKEIAFYFDPDYSLPCMGTYEVTISTSNMEAKGFCEVDMNALPGKLLVTLFHDSIIGSYEIVELNWNNFIADLQMNELHAQTDFNHMYVSQ
ncbi:FAD synthetase family protein [Halobacillus sp. Marseille-P3879]|uniref:FAD synthetase family protein n=1 Tax=Halobacillus sp. Marseille-P3879 TaxID=2045014 RepID=UPI00135800CC|nr:FAD synthetase family protein [Halobacillus sp. Marseille-P3879]